MFGFFPLPPGLTLQLLRLLLEVIPFFCDHPPPFPVGVILLGGFRCLVSASAPVVPFSLS